MIPKKIFFIWIGNNIPKYVDFSINTFKNTNPDFNIELIHIENLKTSDNIDVIETKEKLKDKNSELYKIYDSKWKYKNLYTDIGKNVHFSDVFRIHIINKYGGIYLDCDTFPLKPFDDKLLSHNCFSTTNYFYDKKCNGWHDIFFMGCEKGKYKHLNNFYIKTYTYSHSYLSQKNISEDFLKSRNNFLNCICDYNIKYIPKNEYVLHFKTLEWKK